ncbi:hypothetical protein DVH05_000962 [Phytophthora capsici]|nr:hypothetical protein DVH05_000962 [Phytophthora capsici]
MKCAKTGCEWGDVPQADPASVCRRQVHHLCSNTVYDGAELSKRFCSRVCVQNFLNSDKGSQDCTPNSTSDISRSSQETVINLAQDDPDADEDTFTDIPSLARPKKALGLRTSAR